MLELYTHPMSPCAQKVRIVLAEKSLDWVAHHVELEDKANLKPAYLALNPLGVVPTLVHDGRPVIESSIICEFLDDSWPEPSLKPADMYLTSENALLDEARRCQAAPGLRYPAVAHGHAAEADGKAGGRA